MKSLYDRAEEILREFGLHCLDTRERDLARQAIRLALAEVPPPPTGDDNEGQ